MTRSIALALVFAVTATAASGQDKDQELQRKLRRRSLSEWCQIAEGRHPSLKKKRPRFALKLRLKAVDALEASGLDHPRIRESLTAATRSEDSALAERARAALAKLAPAKGAPAPEAAPAEPELVLEGPGLDRMYREHSVRDWCRIALRRHPLSQTPSEAVIEMNIHAAALALGAVGRDAPIAAKVLLRLLKNPKVAARTRCETIKSLERIGPAAKEVAPALKALFGDSSFEIQKLSRSAWSRLTGDAAPPLEAGDPARVTLRGHSLEEWCAIAEGRHPLGKPGYPNRDANRKAAAFNLGELGRVYPRAVEVLAAMLDDPDRSIRIRACECLGSLGDKAGPAIPALKKMAQSSDTKLADAARGALARLGA